MQLTLTLQIPVIIPEHSDVYEGGDTVPVSKAQPELSEPMTHVHDTVEPYILDTENIVRIIDSYFQPTALQESWKYFCEHQDAAQAESACADSHKDIISEIFKIHVHEDLQYIWPYGPVDLTLTGDRINKFWNYCLKPIGSHEQIVLELVQELGLTDCALARVNKWILTPEASAKMLQTSTLVDPHLTLAEQANLSKKINKLLTLAVYKCGLNGLHSVFLDHRDRFRHINEPETLVDVHWTIKAQVVFEYIAKL